MQIGFKTRCYPGRELAQVLARWIGCQRFTTNSKHDELYYLLWLRKRAILSPSWTDPDPQAEGFPLDQTFSQYKNEELTPWLSEIPSQILRNGIVLYKRAWSNHFKNPGHFGTPNRKRKWDRNSVWITSELFRIIDKSHIEIGTKANPIGILPFVSHRDIGNPNSIIITRTRYGHWFLSCSQELEGPELAKDEDRILELSKKSNLEEQVLGIDRGIIFNAACSNGMNFKLKDEKIKRLEKKRRRYQRSASRGIIGSHRRDKKLAKAAKCSAKIAAIRNDFLRKAAFEIAELPQTCITLEDLNLRGMKKKPKAKKDENGKWAKNGAVAKAGLNKALANAGLGNLKIYLDQALRKRGKLLIEVPAHYSSQECSTCGYVHSSNRPDQRTFCCQKCGHQENADSNASKVIKKRGIALIKSTVGTTDSARTGSTRLGRSKQRGAIRRKGTFAASEKRETPSSKEDSQDSFVRRRVENVT